LAFVGGVAVEEPSDGVAQPVVGSGLGFAEHVLELGEDLPDLNPVERCFSKLKHSRRLATRCDKTADSYLGFILVASIRLWVRRFVNRT
jgi:hypothetical protein